MTLFGRFSASQSARLLAELVILSLGVYFAFQMDNFREQLAENKVKRNYYQLILQEFKSNLADVKRAKTSVDQQLEALKKTGPDAAPHTIRSLVEVDLSNNLLVIKAAFDSGHLENLKPHYVSSLSQGANAITRVADSVLRYNDRVNRILERHDYQTSTFYNESFELYPRYRWLIEELELIQQYLQMLTFALEKGAIPDTEKLVDAKD